MSDNPLITAPLEEVVPLYSGEDQARLEAFDDAIDDALERESKAEASPARRMSSPPVERRSKALAAERDAFLQEAEARVIQVRLRGLNRRKREALLDDHLPRPEKPRDQALGYNTETFPPALVHACIVEPAVTFEQVLEFDEESSAARFDKLFAAAQIVSRMDTELPKSSAVSVLDQILGPQ